MRLRTMFAALAATTMISAAVPAAAGIGSMDRADVSASPMHLAALGDRNASSDPREVGIVFFEEGETRLSADSRKLLDRLPQILDLNGETQVVIHSPDSDPALAALRAGAVQDYLASTGVTETRIEQAGPESAGRPGGVLLSGSERVVLSTAGTDRN